jgi:hypothetical protein
MTDDGVARRTVLGLSVGALASLAGCSGLFVEEPASETTPPATPPVTPPVTAPPSIPGGGEETATPTPTPTRTPEPTATPELLPGNVIEVSNVRLSLQESELQYFTQVAYRFEVENAGRRPVVFVEFRLDLRYEHEEYSRVVATDYQRFRFDDGGDDGNGNGGDDGDGDGDDDALAPDSSATLLGDFRFERDGRAQESTDLNRFDLELTIRRLEYA